MNERHGLNERRGSLNVLLNPGFLLVILKICSQNQANVVFIAGLKKSFCHTNAKLHGQSFISCLCFLPSLACHYFLKAQEVTLSCSYRSTRLLPPDPPIVATWRWLIGHAHKSTRALARVHVTACLSNLHGHSVFYWCQVALTSDRSVF